MTHAGGVIVRDGAAGREYLIATSSSGMGWVLPKGVIDPGETAEEAAVRECEEEVGVVCEIVTSLGDVDITKGDYTVRVRYFVMRVLGQADAHEDRDIAWVDAATAKQRLNSDGARAMIDRAEAYFCA